VGLAATSVNRRGGGQVIPRPRDCVPGDPPPWAAIPSAARAIDLDRVRRVLSGRVGVPSEAESDGRSRGSAVLAALYPTAADGRGDIHVLLTRRAAAMRAHSGEMSFPGGRMDPGETAVEAALREAHEEVALDPSGVEAVGELDHLWTVTSGAFIVPIVAVLAVPPEGLVAQPAEVEAIRSVPLAELLRDGTYHEERWRFPVGSVWAGGRVLSIHFFELDGDTVWGATAAMLRQLLALVLGVDADSGLP
jgi:8-oxo-dGTP pyrophosphatase MutT (NUDIX family)